jgi:subtilisin family serine protease
MLHSTVLVGLGAAALALASGTGPKPSVIDGAAATKLARATAPVKLWVYFKDKGFPSAAEQDAAIAHLRDTYDSHAIERRRMRRTLPGLFDASDLPVAPAYIAAVVATGAKVHIETSWLNAASVYATAAQAQAIAALPFVTQVAPVIGGRRPVSAEAPETPEGRVSGPPTDDFYGLAHDQLAQINLINLHAQGYTGAGVRVGILDTGFRRSHVAFTNASHPLQVIAEHDYVGNDDYTMPQPGDDGEQHTHGTMILGCLGAYAPGDLVGGAYDAAFILCKTEDILSETPVEEDNYVAGIQFIESHGGDVATASLVYSDWYSYAQFNGVTAPTSIAVNQACANGVYCCNAVGNSGHDSDPAAGHIGGVPADALQVLSIGSVTSTNNTSSFSSDGPTADGRLKPEILARGSATYTDWPYDDVGYTTASGTSLSTPVAAAAVACLAQARPWWTVAEMRSHLMNTAQDFVADGHPDPLLVRGYGILDAAAALASDCYANCDGSSGSPRLNANDFQCFLNKFAALNPYANCDHSSTAPTLNANDFQCFLNAFASGCP